ncbi:MAG: HAMP domain-containing histidine kinase [Clostridia bacterium]|nr:HAMP domain-containing histidine kinase [Clostridia bacterium]
MKRLKKWTHSIHFYFTLITMLEITVTVIAAALIDELVRKILGFDITIPSVLWLPLISIIIGSALATAMNYIFFAPVTRLGKAMNNVAKGEFGVTVETKTKIREIKDLYNSFNLMTKELANTEVLQTDFVSNVSHEFKTPINAIEGYATLLQDGTLAESDKNIYVDKILLNTKRLSELVGNILLLSKLDNSSIPSKQEKYRLDEQIRQSILLLEPKWEQKDITFDLELDEVEYYGNESLMHHVWTNLIDNAIKFSPVEGDISISLKSDNSKIYITVEDCGAGIPDDKINNIFDRFYQVDSSHKEEGNGLGLALVKRILDNCCGTVQASNRDCGGCRLFVTLERQLFK